ncbi:MAG: hypothetical protein JWQ38_2940 [Flavipsychrobacter sp.]|nr:hypothetical protein [Flavipsychrobacter sp.]
MSTRNRKRLPALLLLSSLLAASQGRAQKMDTVSSFSVTGYVDAYYAYYTDSVGPGNFQKFPSVSPRSNAPSLNTAQIAVQYTSDKVRGTAVLHFGDIAAATWSPAPFNHLMEAHAGFKVCNKLWVDAGFFRTHFGTEFLLPSENLTSSVAVGTFYEPYYESGLRLNFDPTPKLEINVFLLNGYGMYVDNNEKKSMGMGITYALSDKGGIGYTNYIGDDSPPGITTSHLRFHNNLFLNYQFGKLKLQVGGDYCIQQNADAATGTKQASMYSALATLKYQCTNKFAIYGRGEIFQDPDGYMSTLITDVKGKLTGYKLAGFTLGAEFKPTDESYIRLEGRTLMMDKDQYIFTYNNAPQNVRYEVMVHGGITFDILKSIKTKFTAAKDNAGIEE